MRLMIDPGHGGPDGGASAHGIVEADLVLEIAHRLAALLEDERAPVETLLSRGLELSQKRNLSERATIGRSFGADLVLSIHANANGNPRPHGLMAFYWPGNDLGQAVAEVIQTRAPLDLRRKDGPFPAFRATWPRVRNVLQPHGAPAVLVELGFLTNPGDARALSTPEIKSELVRCLAAGVAQAVQLHQAEGGT